MYFTLIFQSGSHVNYNRTYVELKFKQTFIYICQHINYNRTYVELKLKSK